MNIEVITGQSFAPYGVVLEFPQSPPDPRFHVVITEQQSPWRLAVYRVAERSCDRLECHPSSLESFEPLAGTGLLIVAEPDTPAVQRVFLLDKPVCLYKGVWHQMITLSQETLVKITENLEVGSEFYTLPTPICVMMLPETPLGATESEGI